MKRNCHDKETGPTLTTEAPAVPATANAIPRPEFIRLPAPGTHCVFTGLTRSGLNELILPCAANRHRPPVRSVCLRKRGAKRGVRLINFDSLLAYLHGLESGGSN